MQSLTEGYVAAGVVGVMGLLVLILFGRHRAGLAAGVGVLVLAGVLAAVSYAVVTPREQVAAATRGFLEAAGRVRSDPAAFEAYLLPEAVVLSSDGRVMADLPAVVKRLSALGPSQHRATLLEPGAVTREAGGTAVMTVRSVGGGAGGAMSSVPVRTGWRVRWVPDGGDGGGDGAGGFRIAELTWVTLNGAGAPGRVPG